jgi:intergrase/recombinase
MPDLYDKMIDATHKHQGKIGSAMERTVFFGDHKWLDKEMERLKKEYDSELDRLQKEAQITDA